MIRMDTRPTTPVAMAATLLGDLAAWMGLIVAPAYAVGFAASFPRHFGLRATGIVLDLPVVLPAMGIGLATFAGLLAALAGERKIGRLVAGLAINVVPLILALLLTWMNTD